ncbi:MAG: phosphodiester glycosidase family protein [bacterium]|nr:phosphodiester glycosidase family protein [bacterium]
MERLKFLLILTAFTFFGFGCIPEKYNVPATSNAIHEDIPAETWEQIAPYTDRFYHYTDEPNQALVVLYRFRANAFSWRFAHDTTAYGISQWARRIPEAAFISNGVFFHEVLFPSGFLKINSETIGKRQFDLDRSGLITLRPEVRIIDTETEKIDFNTITDGAQSFPFLIKNGAVAIQEDSALSARRTFFGTDDAGNVYIGIVPYRPLTLFALAQELETLDVPWDHVLNLDGGPSSGIISSFPNSSELFDSFTTVPNVLVVEPK